MGSFALHIADNHIIGRTPNESRRDSRHDLLLAAARAHGRDDENAAQAHGRGRKQKADHATLDGCYPAVTA
jgi:hypothetical protein